MANGKEHTRVINKTIPGVFFIGIFLSYILSKTREFNIIHFITLMISFYKIGDHYLSPDLDIKSNPYYNWKIFRFIWIPYRKLIKHRSILSHGLIIGTILRLVYLYCAFVLVFLCFTTNDIESILYNTTVILQEFDLYFLAAFLGLELSSICHITLDHISTSKKRRRTRAQKLKVTRRGSLLI